MQRGVDRTIPNLGRRWGTIIDAHRYFYISDTLLQNQSASDAIMVKNQGQISNLSTTAKLRAGVREVSEWIFRATCRIQPLTYFLTGCRSAVWMKSDWQKVRLVKQKTFRLSDYRWEG